MRPSAFVLHPDCGLHDTGWRHPEHQGRLPAVAHAVYKDTPALLAAVLQVEGVPAAVADLLRVHHEAYVELVRSACARAEESGELLRLDPDTVVSPATWAAALAAAGCALTATRLVLDGDAASAFAACRPPGHHASARRAMGFCLFNNVAVAARWAQQERGVGRVLIVDFDVHHGNGTQDIFYQDPDVYFLSLHLRHHYPGTGQEAERGSGAGTGTTRNVALERGTSPADYHRRFDEALAAALMEFSPELVLVSAGFDCLAGDPLGGLQLEPADVYRLMRRLVEAGAAPVVGVLEGGYVPKRIGAGVVAVLRALADLPASP
jgi:acetoin utilization deacetylase AcuC-like enzyme